LPTSESVVQALPSSQLVGQFPSQVSPGSSTPLPQLAPQSLSLLALQVGGQQPSPPWQTDSGSEVHTELPAFGSPVSVSVVQALPSSQLVGQFPSHSSGPSTIVSPQTFVQSLSESASHPMLQQPSPSAQPTGSTMHRALQSSAEP
jgi:hypothetical protein